MIKNPGKSIVLEGYRDTIAMNADRVAAAIETSSLSAGERLETARSSIVDNCRTTDILISAIGGFKKPADREPYELAVKETQMANLDLVTALLPTLEKFATTAPRDTVKFAMQVMPVLHIRREDREDRDFASRRDETEARLGQVGAAALVNVGPAKYSFETETWLRSAQKFIPFATPEVRTQLFDRSEAMERTDSAVGKLKWDLQTLRQFKYASEAAPAQ